MTRLKAHIKYEYPHMGLPTQKAQLGEMYSSKFKMYTSGGEDPGGLHIQYHRFEKGS